MSGRYGAAISQSCKERRYSHVIVSFCLSGSPPWRGEPSLSWANYWPHKIAPLPPIVKTALLSAINHAHVLLYSWNIVVTPNVGPPRSDHSYDLSVILHVNLPWLLLITLSKPLKNCTKYLFPLKKCLFLIFLKIFLEDCFLVGFFFKLKHIFFTIGNLSSHIKKNIFV